MANIYSEHKANEENVVSSNAKLLTARIHSIKKQAFNELKNVLCVQPGFTPIGGKIRLNENTSTNYSHNTVQQQQWKQTSKKSTKLAETRTTNTYFHNDGIFSEEVFWDHSNCSKLCSKDEQIWAEMNMIDDVILDAAIYGSDKNPSSECNTYIFFYDDLNDKDLGGIDFALPLFNTNFYDNDKDVDLHSLDILKSNRT